MDSNGNMDSNSKANNEPQNDVWVFLSHSNEDYEKVRVVRNLLEENDLRPLMFFLKCLDDDDEIEDLIKREIDSRTRFILCDSKNARKSNWVKREVEYIKEQQRTFFTIDISKSKEELKKEIKDLYSTSHIFLSYTRSDHDLAEKLYERLKRYDYGVFFDITSMPMGVDFSQIIQQNIEKAKKSGLFVSLVNRETLTQGNYANRELEIAIEKGNRIVPVLIEKGLPDTPLLKKLKEMEYVDISESENMVEAALRHILSITHQPGSILAIAQDLSKKKHKKDKELYQKEIDLCGRIILEKSADNPSNYRLLSLKGKCYELGLGTPVDLEKAYKSYSEAYNKGNIENAKEGMLRMEAKLGINQNQYTNPGPKGAFSKLWKLFRGK